jgi:hypothetical protein
METENSELNDDWIAEFERNDKLYQDFYKDDIYYINLKCVYVNRDNEIDKINTETFLMSTPNIISREEFLQILKRSSLDADRRYSLLSILRYNITLDADDVRHFLSVDNPVDTFLTVIKTVDSISFEKTIHMMQDLNDLVLIFYEKSTELKQITSYNTTKRVYLHPNGNKRTIKKRYKE